MKHRLFSLLSRAGLVAWLAVAGSAYAGSTSASIIFHIGTPPVYVHSGPVYYRHAPPPRYVRRAPPPRHMRRAPPPRQVWVPGHWETRPGGGYHRPPEARIHDPSRVDHHRAYDRRRNYYRP